MFTRLRFALFAVLFVTILGCPAPPSVPPKPPPSPHVAAWRDLVRDYPTAIAYVTRRVRFTVGKRDWAIRDGQVVVWHNDRTVPPILLLVCLVVPIEGTTIDVIGTITEVKRDGIWRHPRADFFVTVTDCVPTAVP